MNNDRTHIAPDSFEQLAKFTQCWRRMAQQLRTAACLISLFFIATFSFSAQGNPGVDTSKIEYYETMPNIAVSQLSSTTNGNNVAVTVVFKNSSDRSQSLYYRIVWLDQGGNAVASRVPWNVLAIGGNSDRSISLTTDDPAASNYRIQISLGKSF
ncbi:YcfL family protein [Paraburkholderia flagellata]|uniref:YcfL family protein n=1 Tax=Paraburkholderia flagellata TaxID=2883241 RepID=UPI001F316884|nr:YcfL family protein [Paraburkholderia flagellata]